MGSILKWHPSLPRTICLHTHTTIMTMKKNTFNKMQKSLFESLRNDFFQMNCSLLPREKMRRCICIDHKPTPNVVLIFRLGIFLIVFKKKKSALCCFAFNHSIGIIDVRVPMRLKKQHDGETKHFSCSLKCSKFHFIRSSLL